MSAFAIVEATFDDVRRVAGNLRPEHVRELRGLSRLDPAEAVRQSADASRLTLAGKADGVAVCLAGVDKAHILDDAGSVWMVATPEIDAYALEAAAALRELFAMAHDLAGTDRLEQWLPDWYAKGRKWLRWLGWREGECRLVNGAPHWRMTHERPPNGS